MSGVLHGVAAAFTKNPTPIAVVNTFAGSTLTSGSTSVTFSSVQVGDLLVAAGGFQQLQDPTFTSGWEKATSISTTDQGASPRGVIVVSKRATATSETLTITAGTGSSSTIYSSGIAFRSAPQIGATATNAVATFNSTVPLPNSLSLLNQSGRSAIACFCFVSNITGNSFGFTTANGVTYALAQSSWQSGRTLTSATAPAGITAVVEVLNG